MEKPCDVKGDDGGYHCPYVEEKPTSELCKEKCDVDIEKDPNAEDDE